MTFNTNDVIQGLSVLSSVVNQKNSLPILSCLKIENNSENTIKVTSSNSDLWLSIVLNVIDIDSDTTPFCVNANDFIKALRALGDATVTITVDGEKHTINCDYTNGRFSMPYEDATQFPEPQMTIDDGTKINVIGEGLLHAINSTVFAVSCDELRPIMNGVHFVVTPTSLMSVASDGQKLANSCTYGVFDVKEGKSVTIPTKACVVTRDVLLLYDSGNIDMSFNDKAVAFSNDIFKLTARLTEGRYPNWNSVIPTDSNNFVALLKDDMSQALKRVIPMGNANSELIILDIEKNKIVISAEDVEFSKSAKETIPCLHNGEHITIGFKGSSLQAILSNLDNDKITIEFTEPNRAALFHNGEKDNYLSLLMPMAIM